MNNFDYENLQNLAYQLQLKKSGSRTTSWKLMLGILPQENDKSNWIKKQNQERYNYYLLRKKYFSIGESRFGNDPLGVLSQISIEEQEQVQQEYIEDKKLRQQIEKDVQRTQQKHKFFKDYYLQKSIQELLFIWAKENNQYKYQQGLNEILAIIMIVLASEILQAEQNSQLSPISSDQQIFEQFHYQNDMNQMNINSSFQQSNDINQQEYNEQYNNYDNYYEIKEDEEVTIQYKELINQIHNREHYFADCYCIFQRMMDLGVKELYFNRDKQFIKYQDQKDALISQHRQKKIKQMMYEKQDNQKTVLKIRSSKIYNNYLRQLDPQLYWHLQNIEIEPELIFLRQLRCLMIRDFDLDDLLKIWDYFLSTIQQDTRSYLDQISQKQTEILENQLQEQLQENVVIKETANNNKNLYSHTYFHSKFDPLLILDYACVAILQYQKSEIMNKDYDSVNIILLSNKRKDINSIIKYTQRISQIMTEHYNKLQSKNIKDSLLFSIQEDQYFPILVQQEAKNYYQKQQQKYPITQEQFELILKKYKQQFIPINEEEGEEDDINIQDNSIQYDQYNEYEMNYIQYTDMQNDQIQENQVQNQQNKSRFEQYLQEQTQKILREQDIKRIKEEQTAILTTNASTIQQQINTEQQQQKEIDQTGDKKKQNEFQCQNLQFLAKDIIRKHKIKSQEEQNISQRLAGKKNLQQIKQFLDHMKTGHKVRKQKRRSLNSIYVEQKNSLFCF